MLTRHGNGGKAGGGRRHGSGANQRSCQVCGGRGQATAVTRKVTAFVGKDSARSVTSGRGGERAKAGPPRGL